MKTAPPVRTAASTLSRAEKRSLASWTYFEGPFSPLFFVAGWLSCPVLSAADPGQIRFSCVRTYRESGAITGLTFYIQGVVIGPTVNAIGPVVTNGGKGTVGR